MRATISFPVPFSPVSSTVECTAAARSTIASTPLHRRASADQSLALEALAHRLAQREVLAHQLLVRAHHRLVAAALLDRHRHQVREPLEQRAVLLAEQVGAARIEVDRSHHAAAEVHRHAHDRAQAEVHHALRARLGMARGVADQQAPATLGDALHRAPAVADRVLARGGVDGAVLGHRCERAGLEVREQHHAALGMELLDHEPHRAPGQLAEVADRVEQPPDRSEQVARARRTRFLSTRATQPLHHQAERMLAAAVVAEPLERRGRELEPGAHRSPGLACARQHPARELERSMRAVGKRADAPQALERARRRRGALGDPPARERDLGLQRLDHRRGVRRAVLRQRLLRRGVTSLGGPRIAAAQRRAPAERRAARRARSSPPGAIPRAPGPRCAPRRSSGRARPGRDPVRSGTSRARSRSRTWRSAPPPGARPRVPSPRRPAMRSACARDLHANASPSGKKAFARRIEWGA
jgi:hypothetical protein